MTHTRTYTGISQKQGDYQWAFSKAYNYVRRYAHCVQSHKLYFDNCTCVLSLISDYQECERDRVSKRLVDRTLYNLKRCSFLKIMMLDNLQNVRIKHGTHLHTL